MQENRAASLGDGPHHRLRTRLVALFEPSVDIFGAPRGNAASGEGDRERREIRRSS
jgi:hypothetical protein